MCVCIGGRSGISYMFWECMPCAEEDESTMTVNYTVQYMYISQGIPVINVIIYCCGCVVSLLTVAAY